MKFTANFSFCSFEEMRKWPVLEGYFRFHLAAPLQRALLSLSHYVLFVPLTWSSDNLNSSFERKKIPFSTDESDVVLYLFVYSFTYSFIDQTLDVGDVIHYASICLFFHSPGHRRRSWVEDFRGSWFCWWFMQSRGIEGQRRCRSMQIRRFPQVSKPAQETRAKG